MSASDTSAVREHLVYDLMGGPDEHPQLVMRQLSASLGFKLLGATPQSIADQWWFWIEREEPIEWPLYLRCAPWLPINSA